MDQFPFFFFEMAPAISSPGTPKDPNGAIF